LPIQRVRGRYPQLLLHGTRVALQRFLMRMIIATSLALTAIACGASGTSTSSAQVSAISIAPDPCAVGRTATQQMTATATLNDGSKQALSSGQGATWSSANTGTATVSNNGVVVGVNAGVTSITVAFEGATGSLDCTVGP
jgi:hypothetical protein